LTSLLLLIKATKTWLKKPKSCPRIPIICWWDSLAAIFCRLLSNCEGREDFCNYNRPYAAHKGMTPYEKFREKVRLIV